MTDTMKTLRIVLPLVMFLNAMSSWGLTTDEAYQAIPHKRTPYDAQISTLKGPEPGFLAKLFSLADEALVARVTTLIALREGNRSQLERYERQVDRILTALLESSLDKSS